MMHLAGEVTRDVADHDHGDDPGEDGGERMALSYRAGRPWLWCPRRNGGRAWRLGRRLRSRRELRQIGEQLAQVVPGPGTQRQPGPFIELLLREPAGLEVLTELGDRAIPVGV
jgi:hypothetical protein